MSDKWTPGPWRIKDDGETSKIADSANNTIANFTYVHLTGRRSAEEVRANMTLCRAAPDMAKALDALLRVIDVKDIDEAQRAIALGRAALAKARGLA